MKGILRTITMLFLISSSGCYTLLEDVSKDMKPESNSIIVGRVNYKSGPFSLHEFSLAGRDGGESGHLFTKWLGVASEETKEGYFFKMVKPGTYDLYMDLSPFHLDVPGVHPAFTTNAAMMRFKVPRGTLISLGTIYPVTNLYVTGYHGLGAVASSDQAVKFDFTHNENDEDALRLFQKLYPEIYQTFKDKISNTDFMYFK